MAEKPDGARWKRWLRRVVLLALALVVARIVVDLVGTIDWGTVREGVGQLEVWQVAVLVGAIIVRQVFNAWPIAIFIPGLGLPRAVANDQVSIMTYTIAPPPSHIVVRVAMFKSWGIEVARALAGVVMNTVSFFIARWYAPVIGFLLVLYDRFDQALGWAALISGAASAGLLIVVRVIASGDHAAQWVGRAAGRIARRVRSSVEPDTWADSVSQLRGHVLTKLRTGLPQSLLALLVMMLCDAVVLVLAVRFVGVSDEAIPIVEIVAAYMVTYPLTMGPLFGIGIFDAAALAVMVAYAGVAYESYLVAALVVWRVASIGTPLALGALSMLLWRRMSPPAVLAERDDGRSTDSGQ